VDGRPEYLKEAAKASARRLGREYVDLWQFHRPDPDVPYAESIGALVELLDEGVIRQAGISNADVEQIRLAQDLLGGRLVSVQNQYSPAFRSSQAELDLCDELGIAFLPWSPLGGISNAAELGSSFAPFAEVAAELEVSPQQVALAWELAQSPRVITIPGSRRPETIEDSVAAADLVLTRSQKARLDAA
jgi:aryl-alcohol dehydrogenase-like predicted oxidoreductase